MKKSTEFSSLIINNAFQIKNRLIDSGNISENLITTLAKELRLTSEKAIWLSNALEMIKSEQSLYRVLVCTFSETEELPRNAVEKDGKVYVIELVPLKISTQGKPHEECRLTRPPALTPIDDVHLPTNTKLRKPIPGWVVEVIEEPLDSPDIDFHIYYAYEIENVLYSSYCNVGYDRVHWTMGSPGHAEWFGNNIKRGNPITVLVDPSDFKNSAIYGL